MKTVEELLSADSAFPLIRSWMAEAKHQCVVLEPADDRCDALLHTQVSTSSPMGALVYETGGVLVDHGWLRVLGSGHRLLARSLPCWNEGGADGFYLIADDAAGGFFALNGGAFSEAVGWVHYWPPDSLEWEATDFSYSAFLQWCLSGALDSFYGHLRCSTWRADVAVAAADQCMTFYPPLWSVEGSAEDSYRGLITVHEAFDVKQACLRQLDGWA
jgi:hypothetical protein